MTLRDRLFSPYTLISLVILLLTTVVMCWHQSPPDFSSFPAGEKRKVAFINYFQPLIVKYNAHILQQRREVLQWQQTVKKSELGEWQKWKLKTLAERYGLADFDTRSTQQWSALLRRVDIIPPSMAIAQAAKESAWGTSRFAEEGNNFFGQWCYEKGCGLVPEKREAGKDHEVEVFDSPKDSVAAYMHNLNTNDPYKDLRGRRSQLRLAKQLLSGLGLIQGLVSYSERGISYVNELGEMIRSNQLQQLDTSNTLAISLAGQ